MSKPESELEEILKKPNEVEMEDFFETTVSDLENYETHTWNKGEGYRIPNFPVFDEKMEGLEEGFYIFAGESNGGKTAIMANLLWDICTYEENKLFGIYVSLDDSKEEIIPRIIAMDQLIPISAASKPKRYQIKIDNCEEGSSVYEDWLQKRTAGLERLAELRRQFKLVDGAKLKNGEQVLDYLKKAQRFVKAYDNEANIIVAIDALNDLRFSEANLKPGKELNDYIAKQVKDWAVQELKVPIFGSCHLRKLNGNRRPSIDDLKESGEYHYEASAVFLVHNDISKNKQSANIYYNSDNDKEEEKLPIIELDWAKNKKSSYKGRTYNYFIPNMSKASECSVDMMRRFDALIYEA